MVHFLKALAWVWLASVLSSVGLAMSCIGVFAESEVPFRAPVASKSVSQFVRDNANDYAFQFNRFSQSALTTMSPSLQSVFLEKGLIVGDNHPGNWVVVKINDSLKFEIFDLKDAGKGLLISDINRVILSTVAVAKDNKIVDAKHDAITRTLLEAYSLGLRGEAAPRANQWLQNKLEITEADYLEAVAKDLKSKTKNGAFKDKPGVLQKIAEGPERTQILKLIEPSIKEYAKTRDVKILDVATRPRTRGGSVDLKRYWALLEYNGEREIVEFKEVPTPAAKAGGDVQLSTALRFKALYEVYWKELDLSKNQIVVLDGVEYMLRQRKVTVGPTVPYQQKTIDDYENLMALAKLVAYQTGIAHGRQLHIEAEYSWLFERELAELVNALKEFNKQYLKELPGRVRAIRSEVENEL